MNGGKNTSQLSSAKATRSDDCASQLETATQRLLKSLDALEKAEAVVGFKDAEIAAKDRLIDLYKQAIAVKDLIISYQDDLIKRLKKPNSGFMGRLKQILSIAEKAALIAVGVYVGGR